MSFHWASLEVRIRSVGRQWGAREWLGEIYLVGGRERREKKECVTCQACCLFIPEEGIGLFWEKKESEIDVPNLLFNIPMSVSKLQSQLF